jgi:hypothetical protein
MIDCRPRGIFSWNFDLTGEGHQASVEFNWFGEQGLIVIDGTEHRVSKHGLFSGQWSLESPSGPIYQAAKSNLFTRTFEITGRQGMTMLSAESMFGRAMTLSGTGVDCIIRPAHAFTRRATIEGRTDDFPRVCFGFWLCILIWRRNASSGAASST